MKIETISLFADRPEVALTAYLVDAPQKRPAVLICPGGAYLACSDTEAEPVALRWAGLGYHAFVLRYSVYGNPNQIPAKIACASNFPTPVRELGKAMLTIREHAAEWGVDADKIFLNGFSAGANNCALYSVYWHTPLVCGALGADKELLRPVAAVLSYGIYDYSALLAYWQACKASEPLRICSEMSQAMFGTKTPSAAQMAAASPALHVDGHTPPLFLWATCEDGLIPAQQTVLMAQALTRAHRPFEVHIYEHGDHGLSLADQTTAEVNEQRNEDVAGWVALAAKWLQKRFAFALPERRPLF